MKPEPLVDERGLFARVWCAAEFSKHGVPMQPVQANVGFSPRRGTLRGLHYQVAPDLEAKLVRCTRGVVYDVLVDLRPDSPTYLKWCAVELDAGARWSVYVPPLCAHGYLTLSDDAEVYYQASAPFVPESARGVRWNDPLLGIEWPIAVELVSDRDKSWPLLVERSP